MGGGGARDSEDEECLQSCRKSNYVSLFIFMGATFFSLEIHGFQLSLKTDCV